MLKKGLAGAILGLLFAISPVFAADIGITLSERDQQAFSMAPGIMSQCISGLVTSNDVGPCRDVAGFLVSFQKRVEAAQATAKVAVPQVSVPAIEPKK